MTDPAKRVLIVDDDPEVRLLLKTTLRRSEIGVDEAIDGRSALDLLASHRYSVILLDLVLPEVGGREILRHLGSAAPANGGSPIVIVVSGSDEEIEAVDPNTVHGIIRKPFDPIEVASIVRSCVEIKSRLRLETMCLGMMASGPLLDLLSQSLQKS